MDSDVFEAFYVKESVNFLQIYSNLVCNQEKFAMLKIFQKVLHLC